MDGLHIVLVILLGVVSCSHGKMSGSLLEVKVRPGDNITLYCDCKMDLPGVYIVWYRNCSNENHTTLVLKTMPDVDILSSSYDPLRPFPNYHFVKNLSSNSYDLLITNITYSDEGLYYCGTEKAKVEAKEKMYHTLIYRYGNVTTRIICDSSEPHHIENQQDLGLCWTLLFALCPVVAVFSSFLTSIVVYYLCQRKVKEPQVYQQRPDTGGQTRQNQDEDLCYAALEVQKKKARRSDFSSYSAITYHRLIDQKFGPT